MSSKTRQDQKFTTAVASAVKAARLSKGVSQAALAHALGIEATTLSRYEVGARTFPLPLLGRVAEVLGVEVVELLPAVRKGKPDEPASIDDVEAAWEGMSEDRRALLVKIAREFSRS